MSLVNEGYTKVVLITGDKDFVPLLEYIEGKAEIWIVGFQRDYEGRATQSPELIQFCAEGGHLYLDKVVDRFTTNVQNY